MKTNYVFKYLISFIFIVSLGVASCSSSSDDSADEDSDNGSETTNSLAVTYPDDLAVSSITAATTGTASINALLRRQETGDGEVEGDGEEVLVPQNFVEKREEMFGLLNPEAPEDIQFDINFEATPADVGCYGPVVFISGDHPDDATATAVSPNSQNGQLPPFDLGLWEETEGDNEEACAAAQMNKLIGDIENYLNAGLKTSAATVGVAGLEEASLPEAGAEPLDLTDEVDEVMVQNEMPIDIDLAIMNRMPDNTVEGFPIFTTQIEGTIEIPAGDTVTEATFEVVLDHVPEVTDEELASISALKKQEVLVDETYCGEMRQKVVRADENIMNCGNATGHTECIYISYCKDSDTSLTYHLRRGQFCGESDCLDADDNFADGADQFNNMDPNASGDGWGGNFFYIVCHVNPENGSGSCAQAWQAGSQDAATRVLNVTVNADGTGCGYFGFGPEAAEDDGLGTIDRIICNWAGPGGGITDQNYTGQQLAQRQCFERDETTGVFTSISVDDDDDDIDEDLAITYAPTDSCSKAANSFAYGIQNPPTDVTAATAVTNNLVPVSEVSDNFTLPDLPVLPDAIE